MLYEITYRKYMLYIFNDRYDQEGKRGKKEGRGEKGKEVRGEKKK